jgi:hypothetical protein
MSVKPGQAQGGTIVDPKWTAQTVNYANNEGVVWCALTDGVVYRVFKVNEPVDMATPGPSSSSATAPIGKDVRGGAGSKPRSSTQSLRRGGIQRSDRPPGRPSARSVG